MNTMTMPNVGLQMDFSKDIRAAVRSEAKPQDSDFLKQIKSATEGAKKQTIEVKKQTGSAKDADSKKPVKTDNDDENTEDKSEATQENTAAMAELARMFAPQETPVVVDVKEMLIPSEPKQDGVMALGEVVFPEQPQQMMTGGEVVELEQLQGANPETPKVSEVGAEFGKEMQVVLAGQQATESQNLGSTQASDEPIANTKEITPQTANQKSEANVHINGTPQDNTAEKSVFTEAVQQHNQQKPIETSATSKEAVNELAGEQLQEPKTTETTSKTELQTELKRAEATVAQIKPEAQSGQQSSQSGDTSDSSDKESLSNMGTKQEAKPTENQDDGRELFVTDKLRKQMDKLEEMLSRSGMTPAQIKDFKTAEIAKTAVENQDMAPQVQQVTGKIFEAMDNGVNELIMQLQPKELGKLMIKLSMENNRLTINITAETMHAQKAITEQLGLLESSIKSQNVVIDRINVAYDSANNMNSSYNQSGLGGQFENQNRNAQNSSGHTSYMGLRGEVEADIETQQPPKLMIIGNDMLNYVV